jgi:hypothetical protein
MDTIGRCVASDHFQVAERALFLWNNEQLVKNGILNQAHASAVLPMMYVCSQDKYKPTTHTHPLILLFIVLFYLFPENSVVVHVCGGRMLRERSSSKVWFFVL